MAVPFDGVGFPSTSRHTFGDVAVPSAGALSARVFVMSVIGVMITHSVPAVTALLAVRIYGRSSLSERNEEGRWQRAAAYAESKHVNRIQKKMRKK